MKFEITAEINGLNGKIETRLIGDYSITELKTLDKLLEYAIIKTDDSEIRKKDNWVKGDRGLFAGSVSNGSGGRARMTRKEYYKVCHEIVTNHPEYSDLSTHYFRYDKSFYVFVVIEPGTYRFSHKIPLRNRNIISKYERIYADE